MDNVIDYINSPEGKAAIEKMAAKMIRETLRRDKHIESIHEHHKDNINSLIKKVIDKYNSEKYRKQYEWINCGEPP